MSAHENRPGPAPGERDFRSLPPGVRLDETVESVETDDVRDPEAGRNGDHHRALRDD